MRRITKDLPEHLTGKTIRHVCGGGQFLALVFTDDTYVFLDGCQWAMRYDGVIDDSWKVDIGLLDKAVFEKREAAKHRRAEEQRTKFLREQYEELRKMFEEPAHAP